MAKGTIEVLLTEDVLKLGSMGDIVAVRPGYARNFLIPHGKAVLASSAAKRQIEVLQERSRQHEMEREGKALALKKQLDGLQIQIGAKVSQGAHLFGSIGARDIVHGLSASGFTVDQKQVHLHESFKNLGRFEVKIQLFKSVEATIKVEIVNSDPDGPSLDEILAAQEAEREAAIAADIAQGDE